MPTRTTNSRSPRHRTAVQNPYKLPVTRSQMKLKRAASRSKLSQNKLQKGLRMASKITASRTIVHDSYKLPTTRSQTQLKRAASRSHVRKAATRERKVERQPRSKSKTQTAEKDRKRSLVSEKRRSVANSKTRAKSRVPNVRSRSPMLSDRKKSRKSTQSDRWQLSTTGKPRLRSSPTDLMFGSKQEAVPYLNTIRTRHGVYWQGQPQVRRWRSPLTPAKKPAKRCRKIAQAVIMPLIKQTYVQQSTDHLTPIQEGNYNYTDNGQQSSAPQTQETIPIPTSLPEATSSQRSTYEGTLRQKDPEESTSSQISMDEVTSHEKDSDEPTCNPRSMYEVTSHEKDSDEPRCNPRSMYEVTSHEKEPAEPSILRSIYEETFHQKDPEHLAIRPLASNRNPVEGSSTNYTCKQETALDQPPRQVAETPHQPTRNNTSTEEATLVSEDTDDGGSSWFSWALDCVSVYLNAF